MCQVRFFFLVEKTIRNGMIQTTLGGNSVAEENSDRVLGLFGSKLLSFKMKSII